MTNEFQNLNAQAKTEAASAFEFLLSFPVRHSSFVIRHF